MSSSNCSNSSLDHGQAGHQLWWAAQVLIEQLSKQRCASEPVQIVAHLPHEGAYPNNTLIANFRNKTLFKMGERLLKKSKWVGCVFVTPTSRRPWNCRCGRWPSQSRDGSVCTSTRKSRQYMTIHCKVGLGSMDETNVLRLDATHSSYTMTCWQSVAPVWPGSFWCRHWWLLYGRVCEKLLFLA